MTSFLDYTPHSLALMGAVAVHGLVGAWVLQPDPASIVPKQQLVQVQMVAPSIAPPAKPAPAPAPVVDTPPPAPKPPATRGMIKTAPPKEIPKKREAPQPPQVKRPSPQPPAPAQERQTSGAVSARATAHHAASTPPVAASYLNNPPPTYPPMARRKRQQGTTLLQVQVDARGIAQNVQIARSSGYAALDDAARQAVQQWRFSPARKGSTAVAGTVTVPIIFTLR